MSDDNIICPSCDFLQHRPTLSEGQKLTCCQCGHTLLHRRKDSIERTLALSVAGLVAFLPAMILPVIGVSKLGFSNQASLIDCINLLVEQGFPIAALFVFSFTLLVPLLRLLSNVVISACIIMNVKVRWLVPFFRTYVQLNSWAMLQVFMLGIIISMYKIGDLAELTIGWGLASLTLMLTCSTLIAVSLDDDLVWQHLENVGE